jgi:hypothetical protein
VREGEDAEGEMEDVCCIPQPGLRDWSDHHTSYSFETFFTCVNALASVVVTE